MHNRVSISVIVPVYKTERYLQECIDSILKQTYTDFELILVDDGSPDKCGEICDLNAEQDARIRVIHQTNQGVTRARANGVAAAKGTFITFVDSDDTIPSHALATLSSFAKTDVDIVLGNIQHPNSPCPTAGEINIKEYRHMCIVLKGIHNGPVAKLFRRTLFQQDVFDVPRELKVGEDAIMNMRLANLVHGKVYSCGAVVYKYHDNEESVTHTLVPNPEMEMQFGQIRLKSLPHEDLASQVKAELYKSLIAHWLNALHHTPTLPPSVRGYRRFLLSHKKESGFKFNLYSYLLFHCPNQTSLGLFIWLWKKLRWLNKLRFYKLNKATIS